MTILELREKRNKAWEAAKAFLDSHRTEKGTLTAEDDATYTRMEQDINDLGKEIARLERQEQMEAELSKPVNRPLTTKPESGELTFGDATFDQILLDAHKLHVAIKVTAEPGPLSSSTSSLRATA